MHNVEKWPNILSIFNGINTTNFLKYIWSLFNVMNERVKQSSASFLNRLHAGKPAGKYLFKASNERARFIR